MTLPTDSFIWCLINKNSNISIFLGLVLKFYFQISRFSLFTTTAQSNKIGVWQSRFIYSVQKIMHKIHDIAAWQMNDD